MKKQENVGMSGLAQMTSLISYSGGSLAPIFYISPQTIPTVFPILGLYNSAGLDALL